MGQVINREHIAEFVNTLHKSNKTVVATNGCKISAKDKIICRLFYCSSEFR